MISDRENPADKVFLDGKLVDLAITIMADDERGIVEQLVYDDGQLRMGLMGPVTVELKGDVRIVMPPKIGRLN